MISSVKIYKVIAFVSLAILLFVQFRLISYTFELKNNQYNFAEKSIINEAYMQRIRNDKLFPGAQKIMDGYIYRNMSSLEYLYKNDSLAFETKRKLVCDSLFQELYASSNMDSVFAQIIHDNKLENNLQYSLLIEKLSITFDAIKYIPLFSMADLPLYSSSHHVVTNRGMVIDGTLQDLNNQNLIADLNVSTAVPRSYHISFALHADINNRSWSIFQSMLPTFILSFFSIVFVIGIYYITYRNWLKQKKIAEMRSDFLNSIRHEFNTPITTILVANKSMQNEEIITDKNNVRSLIEVVDRQAQRLKVLVSQVLDITQLNKDQLDKCDLDVQALLKEIIHDYLIRTNDEVIIHSNYDGLQNPVFIQANRFLITTMLNNILDNALKYNVSDSKAIMLTIHTTKNGVSLCIEDNGIGMSKKMTAHIFEKFYRGKNTINKSGLGLGLYYVKQVLDAHEWKLTLRSNEGRGSKFCIYIAV